MPGADAAGLRRLVVPRVVVPLVAVVPLAVAVPLVVPNELVVEGVRPNIRDLPRASPRDPLAADVASFFRSSSSAFRAMASLCCWSSSSILSTSCCRNIDSPSISAISLDAPCQEGFRMSR